MLDRQGGFLPKKYFRSYPSLPAWLDLPIRLEVDERQFELLKKLSGNDGPCEIVAFLGEQHDGKWWPVLQYAGIVGLRGDGVFLAQDDLAKDELAESKEFTKKHFLEDMHYECANRHKEPDQAYKEYNAALILAIRCGHYALARALVDAGYSGYPWKSPDVNTSMKDGTTALMSVAFQAGGKWPDDSRIEFLAYLLTMGADPNVANKYGITAMIIADRAGSDRAVKMLEKAGAEPFDPSDAKVKAAIARVDALLLRGILDDFAYAFDGWITSKDEEFGMDFSKMEKAFGKPGGADSKWQITDKVILNRAIDVCGHPYKMHPNAEASLRIDDRTIAEFSGVVGADFWKEFVPPATPQE